jgi:hypothetical protein
VQSSVGAQGNSRSWFQGYGENRPHDQFMFLCGGMYDVFKWGYLNDMPHTYASNLLLPQRRGNNLLTATFPWRPSAPQPPGNRPHAAPPRCGRLCRMADGGARGIAPTAIR